LASLVIADGAAVAVAADTGIEAESAMDNAATAASERRLSMKFSYKGTEDCKTHLPRPALRPG
jgi:hypothetical protein